MTMEIDYLNELSPADFYETVMELADREHVREIQTEDNKVYGCTSNVWVVLEGDKLIFDSSSAFVKGLLTVICSQLSSREDIKNVTLEQYPFLNTSIISYQRLKGVTSFLNRIKQLAN
jgi:sulfur transfer protein SufE|tara:strand:- start:99 stop:452 length:354 start_codon:yes stop_codon:yes gene_type:complete